MRRFSFGFTCWQEKHHHEILAAQIKPLGNAFAQRQFLKEAVDVGLDVICRFEGLSGKVELV